jgi:putative membrane protein
MHGFYDFGFGIGHVSMMLMWIVIIGLVFWAIFSSKGTSSLRGESPLDIAKKRYAKGEISQEELNEIKRNL